MALDPETLGAAGGGGGIIAAVVQYLFGKKNEKAIDELKADIEKHKERAIMKDHCDPCKERADEKHGELKEDINELKGAVAEIRNDVKTLITYSLQRRQGDMH